MSFDPVSLAAPGVRALRPYEPGKPLEDLRRELGLANIIKLASNENPLGPGVSVQELIKKHVSELSRYPDGNGFALKAALAGFYGVNTEQITLGNGSNDVLELVANAFATPDNEVIFSEHAFAVYPLVTQAAGAKAIVVRAKKWGHDLQGMAEAINKKTRLVFIANPNNPTGTWLDKKGINEFLEKVPDHVIVVLDEAYAEYVKQENYAIGMDLLDRYPNLLVTRTFSKIYGLAGLRIGYGVSSPLVADLLNRVRQPFNVNSLALLAAEEALKDKQHVQHSVKLNGDEKDKIMNVLVAMGLSYIPSEGNFLAIDFAREAKPIYQALLENGVIVRPIANYGMPGYLRVTIGLPEENETFIQKLKKVL